MIAPLLTLGNIYSISMHSKDGCNRSEEATEAGRRGGKSQAPGSAYLNWNACTGRRGDMKDFWSRT